MKICCENYNNDLLTSGIDLLLFEKFWRLFGVDQRNLMLPLELSPPIICFRYFKQSPIAQFSFANLFICTYNCRNIYFASVTVIFQL